VRRVEIVAEQKLQSLGLTTLGDVAAAPASALRRIFGAWADAIQQSCRGQGAHELGRERPAFQEHDPSGSAVGSISNERTFREDVRDPGCIEAMLCGLCERVCWRARKRGVKARTVSLKLRYEDFTTLNRSVTLPRPLNSDDAIYEAADGILNKIRQAERRPVRLIGVGASNFVDDAVQLSLEPSKELKSEKLAATFDRVRQKYGTRSIQTGRTAFDKSTKDEERLFERNTGISSQIDH